MNIKGQILNTFNYEPISGAKIAMYCRQGNMPIGETDAMGYFSVEVPDPVQPIVFSAAGFMSVLTDPGTIEDTGELTLTPSDDTENVEVLTAASQGIKKKLPWWVVVGGALAIATFTKAKPKMGKVDYEKYILPAGILIALFYLVNNIGDLFGSNDTKSNNAQATAADEQATNASLNQAAATGDRQILSNSELSGIANSIYLLGTSETGKVSDSTAQQMYQAVSSVESLTDFLLVKKYFGTRKASSSWYSACALIGLNCDSFDLDSFLRASLPSYWIGAINNYFQSAAIKYNL